MPRRTKATIIIILLILLLVALAAYLRRKAPPEVARLLPESDCILYFNLRPLRDLYPLRPDPGAARSPISSVYRRYRVRVRT